MTPASSCCPGNVLAYFGEDIDAAIKLIDHALILNPSFADGWHFSGMLRLWAGQPEPAISHFETSLRLSPHFRAFNFQGIGMGYFLAQRFGEAAAMLLRALQEQPSWPPSYRILGGVLRAYGAVGRRTEHCKATASHYTRNRAGKHALARPSAPQTLSFWPAVGCWRSRNEPHTVTLRTHPPSKSLRSAHGLRRQKGRISTVHQDDLVTAMNDPVCKP